MKFMCLKNKIIAVGLSILVALVGFFAAGSPVSAQNTSTAGMTIEQMQQLIVQLQQQITQILQLLLAQNKIVCGDGNCNSAYENATNCAKDCGATACIKEGAIFTGSAKGCCAGLTRQAVPSATQTASYKCVNLNPKTCTAGSVNGCQVCNSTGTAWVDTSSKCATGQKCYQGACLKCGVENEKIEEGRDCCVGLVRSALNNGGLATTERYICQKPAVTKNGCITNADCVSDGGTCHACLNRTWWNAQTTAVKTQYMCYGIGDSICQCKSGNCTSVAICGDGTCNATYENSTNCASDCKPIATSPVTQYGCTINTDCISDGGTCHKCFNRTWFKGQVAASGSSPFVCDGIGDSICQCKSGTCTSVAICGDGTCNATYENSDNCANDCGTPELVPPTPVTPKTNCSGDTDCVSDEGNCHQCFNKTWWTAQTAETRKRWMCWGIGSSICKCKSGTCTSVAICGDGTCNATYENSTNCAKDCPAVSNCTLKNNGCSYTGGFMTYNCADNGGGNFVAAGCNNYCEPYGKCYRADGTTVSVGVAKR